MNKPITAWVVKVSWNIKWEQTLVIRYLYYNNWYILVYILEIF